MSVDNGLEWTFDTVAPKYEKMRPGYVPEVYETIFSYVPVGPGSSVVEVGSGAGQATAPVLRTGCTLTAVEFGEKFSELLREKFREYPSFSVINGRFEKTEFPANAIQKLYDEYNYTYYKDKKRDLRECTEEIAKERAMIAAQYGFTDIRYHLFHRKRNYMAKEYTELLGTYSDHIAIGESVRNAFFAKIEETINDYGGEITIYDTIDLQLARK